MVKNDSKRVKNAKWLSWTEFECIKNYLINSIGSKSSQIDSNRSYEEIIKTVNLSNSLLGIEVFFKEFLKDSDVQKRFGLSFDYPHEILDYYNEIRSDLKKVNNLKQCIEYFIMWLKTKKVKKNGVVGLGKTTATAYQAQLRGFLSWNHVNLKFKNYNEETAISEEYDKFSIGYEELMQFAKTMIEYAPDFELTTICKWLYDSGLGIREILEIRMLDLRHKDFSKEYVRIDHKRVKTGVKFTTFLYGKTKEDVITLMNLPENKEKAEEDYLFGDKGAKISQTYNNLERKFKRAYMKMISEKFPQYMDADKTLFTFHKFRKLFISACKALRIPQYIEDRFVAHKVKGLDRNYTVENELLDYFKKIQEELHGVRESSTREEIKKEIIANLTDALLNRGRRIAEHKKHSNMNEEEREKLSSKIQFDVLTQELINVAKQEIIKDKDFIRLLAQEMKDLEE